jgi:hypothetical protein
MNEKWGSSVREQDHHFIYPHPVPVQYVPKIILDTMANTTPTSPPRPAPTIYSAAISSLSSSSSPPSYSASGSGLDPLKLE